MTQALPATAGRAKVHVAVAQSTGDTTSNNGEHVKALARWLQVLTALIAGGCLALFAVLEVWWPAIVAAFVFGGLSAFLVRDIQRDAGL